ncbi:MAG: hypothetical protein IJL17_14895 [Kiritimatiellae bacterium]|nr:hypothetical protein [Kiritimatiellia bacterium]
MRKVRSVLSALAAFAAAFSTHAAVQPYDVALEYVESTGVQYLDTGLVLSNDVKVTMDIALTSTSGIQKVFGSRDGASSGNISLIGLDSFLYSDFNNGDYDQYRLVSNVGFSRVMVELSASQRRVLVERNGVISVLHAKTQVCPHEFCTSGTALIFDMNGASGNGAGTWSRASARIYSLTIDRDGTRLRDYQPCIRNGVAGLYDRVGGKFLPPTAGGLVAGPAVPTPACDLSAAGAEPILFVEPSAYPVTYIQGDGTAYLDTGLTLSNAMYADIAYEIISGNGATGVFGSRKSASENNIALSCDLAGAFQGTLRSILAADFLGSGAYWNYRASLSVNDSEGGVTNVPYATHLGPEGCRTTNLFTRAQVASSANAWGESGAFATPTSAMVFRVGGTDWATARAKLYSLVIREGGDIIREYRPYVKDGVACLSERLSGSWLCNANAQGGTLTAGPPAEALAFTNLVAATCTNASGRVGVAAVGAGAAGCDVFAVTAAAPPYDRAVAYLEGDGTQYIDTGLVISSDMTVSLAYDLVDAGNGPAGIFGSRTGADNRNAAVSYATTSQVSCDFANGSFGTYRASLGSTQAGQTYDAVLSATRRSLTLRGGNSAKTNTADSAGNGWTTPGTAWIFGTQNTTWSYGKVRVRSLRIEQGGDVIRDYQPCVKDGVACMYERVEGVFLYGANRAGNVFAVGETIPATNADLCPGTGRKGPMAFVTTNLVLSASGAAAAPFVIGPLQPGTRYATCFFATNGIGGTARYPAGGDYFIKFTTSSDAAPAGGALSLDVAYAPDRGSRLALSVTRAGTAATQLHALYGAAYGGASAAGWSADEVIGAFAAGAATLSVPSPRRGEKVNYLRLYTADGEWSQTIHVPATGLVRTPLGMTVIIK